MLITVLVGLVSNFPTKTAAEYVNSYTENTFNNPVLSAMSYYIEANYYVYTDGKEISDRQRSALYPQYQNSWLEIRIIWR